MRPIPHLPRPHRARAALAALALALVANIAPAPALAAEPDWPASRSGYHNWPELVGEVRQAAVDHPDIVSVFSIGRSYQGRVILMAKISDNVAVDEDEPEILIDALHHAREHLTSEQALAILRWLTDGYGTDEETTRLVDERETFIIFAVNPDGMRYDLTGTPFRAWRKNLQRTASGVAMFTDLNRNYGYRWGCCNGSSSRRLDITYRGPRAWSAPEVRAVRDFVNSRVVNGVQQIRAHITLHTNGELILWPYGYTKSDVPPDMTRLDRNAFAALGRAMAARNGYRPMQSSDLYITDGDQIDWMYGVHRIFSFTFELYPPETPSVWGDHYPDDSRIGPQTERNRSAILYLLDQAACPYAVLGESTARMDCGPLFDDLEINRGWTRSPDGLDTATGGTWAVGDPEPTALVGPIQPGTASSGAKALVTGAAAGVTAADNDVDGGTTTIRSRAITLPADAAAYGPLSVRYAFAHDAGATADDALRVYVETEDGVRTQVFEVLGTPETELAGTWTTTTADLAAWAGQAIRIVVAATDGGAENVVEAAVDDLRIELP